MSGPFGSDDPDGVALGRLLTDLADDPDAPPTSVSALSVLAAAKSGGVARDGAGPVELSPAATAAPAVAASGADPASVGELHVLAVQQDAERRARRRRTWILSGLAAACVVAVAAIVVPLTLSSSGGTTTAGAPADTAADRAQSEAAAAAPSEQTTGGPGATDLNEGGAAPTIDPSNPDANRPPPGESALTNPLPVPGVTEPTAGAAAGDGVESSCWPALSDASSAALVAALPAGSFGDPGLLGLGCPADPVAGASLTGTAGNAQLVVRVTRADPGACAQASSETGAKCVARGADQYVSNDAGNLSVFAYGNGYEVEVGGRPATGIAPIPSGLTADQLGAAAVAVLGSLG